MKNVHLLIIDPQVDFCDPDGALYVPGAEKDMERLANFIKNNTNKISQIHVTLDQHHLCDVSHPQLWVDKDGNHPKPVETQITVDDVNSGKWSGILPQITKKFIEYLKKLEDSNRYPHTIWPPHCLIGYPGSNLYAPVAEALQVWVDAKLPRWVNFVAKGSNPFTEHFSGVRAEVPDPSDPLTQINTGLVQALSESDVFGIAGEALSHCVANTVRDIAQEFKDDSLVSKMVLLEDATSSIPVPIFEQASQKFIKDMTAKGMSVKTTETWLK